MLPAFRQPGIWLGSFFPGFKRLFFCSSFLQTSFSMVPQLFQLGWDQVPTFSDSLDHWNTTEGREDFAQQVQQAGPGWKDGRPGSGGSDFFLKVPLSMLVVCKAKCRFLCHIWCIVCICTCMIIYTLVNQYSNGIWLPMSADEYCVPCQPSFGRRCGLLDWSLVRMGALCRTWSLHPKTQAKLHHELFFSLQGSELRDILSSAE